ncbi:MAG TPA: hypothetical protein VFB39_13150 [Solirubrobacteraceae bacterium]|nr:hypothetical protein [Solirubrobacteraceae bacterium]
MKWRSAFLLCASALLMLVLASSAAARTNKTGYDISYPQCGRTYPTGQAFGLVGVNGGLANDENGCLGSEIAWAQASPGLTSPSQAPASIYINTADPGPAPGVTDWPHSGTDQYGSCHGGWSKACAYVYGEQRATYSYNLVGASHPDLASEAPWWLDIETSNTWATSSVHGYKGLNIVAIQGFIAGLTSQGAAAPVGVYSSTTQWKAITGLTAQTTRSAFGSSPPAWVAAASTLKGAHSVCSSTAFTGVKPTLAQYSSNGFDGDLRCG